MKKIFLCTLMILVFVALAIGCGGGGDKDKKTPETSAPPTTPTQTIPTAEPSTPTPEPSPTPEPTVQPSPTATSTPPDTAEAVLAPVMTHLVVAFAEIDGQWQAYPGPNALELSTLENNQIYWWYATETITLESITLYKGWNNMMWLSPTAPIASALAGYETQLPFVIRTDIRSGQNYLYRSPAVGDLTIIPVGQTYYTFVAPPGNLPQMATQTR